MPHKHAGDAPGVGELVAREPAAARAAVEAALERAAALNPALNAFVELRDPSGAEGAGASGPLAGAPIAVKDMFVDAGRAPTVGSEVGGSWLSGTAAVLRRLRRAGATVVGYTNLHEWGLGMTSGVTATGPIRNPLDLARAPGGSSGGSAAAVAAGCVPAAIGADAGGSIRCPAACCGIVGLKPTWGLVEEDGYVTAGCPIDHIGPMARSVGDVSLVLEALVDRPLEPADVGSLRVGVARRHFFDDLDPEFEAGALRAVEVIKSLVSEVVEVELEGAEQASWAIGYILLPFTARMLADDIERRPGAFQPWTLRLLRVGGALDEIDPCGSPHPELIGTLRDTLSTKSILDFAKLPGPVRRLLGKHLVNPAQGEMARQRLIGSWERVFAQVDVVVTPTIPAPPPLISDPVVHLRSGPTSPDKAYLPLLGPMNLGGVPSLSMPCAETRDGWPISVSLTAARGRDGVVLSLGRALEEALEGRYANRVGRVVAS